MDAASQESERQMAQHGSRDERSCTFAAEIENLRREQGRADDVVELLVLDRDGARLLHLGRMRAGDAVTRLALGYTALGVAPVLTL